MEISGAVALVTGGCKGLGRGISDYLHEQGAKVIIIDRDEDAITKLPDHFTGVMLDITNHKAIKEAIKNIYDEHGQIDILINNAGVICSKPLVNIMNPDNLVHDYESFRDALTANLDTVFIMTTKLVEQLIPHRRGAVIINLSSISSGGNEGQTAYSAAKAGVNAMTVTWAKELARFGFRCNAVAPGFIDSESTRAALSESIIEHIETNTPLKRLGKVEEVAQAVGSLITNDFMNGVILNVDGGLRI